MAMYRKFKPSLEDIHRYQMGSLLIAVDEKQYLSIGALKHSICVSLWGATSLDPVTVYLDLPCPIAPNGAWIAGKLDSFVEGVIHQSGLVIPKG